MDKSPVLCFSVNESPYLKFKVQKQWRYSNALINSDLGRSGKRKPLHAFFSP